MEELLRIKGLKEFERMILVLWVVAAGIVASIMSACLIIASRSEKIFIENTVEDLNILEEVKCENSIRK